MELKRAREGGHCVDDLALKENFYSNLQKLDTYFILFDQVTIVDTSGFDYVALVISKKCNVYQWRPNHFDLTV